MNSQISVLEIYDGEDIEDLERQAKLFMEYANNKRKKQRAWEDAFQRWSNKQAQDGTDTDGICGYGSMCDWCKDNSYGRPCIRALNAMCRDKGINIDYSERDFEKIWSEL